MSLSSRGGLCAALVSGLKALDDRRRRRRSIGMSLVLLIFESVKVSSCCRCFCLRTTSPRCRHPTFCQRRLLSNHKLLWWTLESSHTVPLCYGSSLHRCSHCLSLLGTWTEGNHNNNDDDEKDKGGKKITSQCRSFSGHRPELSAVWKRRSRWCWTEVTNKALGQYLFICQCAMLLFKLSKRVFNMAQGGGITKRRFSALFQARGPKKTPEMNLLKIKYHTLSFQLFKFHLSWLVFLSCTGSKGALSFRPLLNHGTLSQWSRAERTSEPPSHQRRRGFYG